MGVEFRLGRQDGHKVEDFLAHEPAGVSAITLSARYMRHQVAAAEGALALDADVLFDPATERLTAPGFELDAMPYWHGVPLDVDRLKRDPGARTVLIAEILKAHPDVATLVTPPHFYVDSDGAAELNIALAEETAQRGARDTRPVLLANRAYAAKHAVALASAYRAAGIDRLELRLTPVGGDDESVRKLQSVFATCHAFTAVGIELTLGLSGNVGHAAVARGHAAHYSVGVGLSEQVDYKAALSRQTAPPKPADESKPRFGAIAGIYLPGPMLLVGRKAGAALLADTDIRTKIGCRLGGCGTSINGPANDPRDHYLHARAHEVSATLAQPLAWRANLEQERLRRAVELRSLINEHYLPDGQHPLKTRTLKSLLDARTDGQAQTA